MKLNVTHTHPLTDLHKKKALHSLLIIDVEMRYGREKSTPCQGSPAFHIHTRLSEDLLRCAIYVIHSDEFGELFPSSPTSQRIIGGSRVMNLTCTLLSYTEFWVRLHSTVYSPFQSSSIFGCKVLCEMWFCLMWPLFYVKLQVVSVRVKTLLRRCTTMNVTHLALRSLTFLNSAVAWLAIVIWWRDSFNIKKVTVGCEMYHISSNNWLLK